MRGRCVPEACFPMTPYYPGPNLMFVGLGPGRGQELFALGCEWIMRSKQNELRQDSFGRGKRVPTEGEECDVAHRRGLPAVGEDLTQDLQRLLRPDGG